MKLQSFVCLAGFSRQKTKQRECIYCNMYNNLFSRKAVCIKGLGPLDRESQKQVQQGLADVRRVAQC